MGLPDFIARLRSSSLLANLAKVTGGSIVAQAIAFAFSPIITRIYGPEAFGIQGVFLSLIAILAPAAALRYPMAIIIAKSDEAAQRLEQLSLRIAFAFALLLLSGLLFFRHPIERLAGTETLGLLIYFLPLALFCTAWQEIMDGSAARRNDFGLAARVAVIQTFSTNVARVIGGMVTPLASVLVFISSVAPALQAGLLILGARRKAPSLLRPGLPEPPNAKALLIAHRDFPLYRVPTDVLNAASQSVPVILLATFFSPYAAGLYALTRTVLNLPFNIIGTAAGNVLYTRFAEVAHSGQRLTPVVVRTTLALFAFAPFIVGAAYFFPDIFAFLFGKQWREAGQYGQWMSLWIAVALANLPTIRAAPVIKGQHLMLVLNILMLASRVLAIVGGATFYGDALSSVILFSVVSAVGNLVLIGVLILAARRFDAQH
ncbi:MAG: lipopolysaccharide biosynthesis protein [Sphingopyxis sp.]